MMSALTEYQSHIESWAKDLGCGLIQKPNLDGMMFAEAEPPYVEIPIIENQVHYITALHELSHIAHQDSQGRPPFEHKRHYFDRGVLHAEAHAWDHALDICLDPIQDETRRFMWDFCLGSYYSHYLQLRGTTTFLANGNRHYIKFIYDHPDKFFERVMKRIQGSLIGYKVQYVGRYDNQ